jgi:hypothetical protein
MNGLANVSSFRRRLILSLPILRPKSENCDAFLRKWSESDSPSLRTEKMASQGRKVSLVRRDRKASVVCQEIMSSGRRANVARRESAEIQAFQVKGDRLENVASRGLREVKARLVLKGFGVFKEIRVLREVSERKALKGHKEREEKQVKKVKKESKVSKAKKVTKGRKASRAYKVRQVTAAKMV